MELSLSLLVLDVLCILFSGLRGFSMVILLVFGFGV